MKARRFRVFPRTRVNSPATSNATEFTSVVTGFCTTARWFPVFTLLSAKAGFHRGKHGGGQRSAWHRISRCCYSWAIFMLGIAQSMICVIGDHNDGAFLPRTQISKRDRNEDKVALVRHRSNPRHRARCPRSRGCSWQRLSVRGTTPLAPESRTRPHDFRPAAERAARAFLQGRFRFRTSSRSESLPVIESLMLAYCGDGRILRSMSLCQRTTANGIALSTLWTHRESHP